MFVKATGVGHAYDPNIWLFTDLALTFEPGRLYALTGASGSGKSTLMAILAGWIAPSRGRVELSGVHRITWVLQSPHGTPRRTALDHVIFPLAASGYTQRESETRAHELLERFRLTDVGQRQFRRLSGGEAQRLMLARATASAPHLLLVDEPTAQLDRGSARVINAVLAQTARDDTIVVVATHDAETRDACHEVIEIAASNPNPES